MRKLLIVLCIGLSGCSQQSTAPLETQAAKPPIAVPAATQEEPPLPVQAFEMHCYRTGANYKTVVAAAEAMKLKPISKDLEPLVAPQQGQGRSFIVRMEKKTKDHGLRAIMLGISDQNACSISAYGYGSEEVASNAKKTYKLFSIGRDDVGLQVNEMFIPDGTSKLISEAHEKGVIGILTAKPNSGSGDAITLSYISPEAARAVFQ